MQVIYEIKRDALWFIGSLESCTQKNGPNLKDENGISLQSPFRSQGPKLREKKINQLLNLSKTDGQSVWLMKCYMQSKGMSYGSLDNRKVICKKYVLNSRDEKVRRLDKHISF